LLDSLPDRCRPSAVALLRDLVRGAAKEKRWTTLRRFRGGLRDDLEVARVAEALCAAGLLEVAERPDDRGDLLPYRYRLPERVAAAVHAWDAASQGAAPPATRAGRAALLAAELRRLVDEDGPLPVPARALIQRVLGASKAVRLEDLRPELERALDGEGTAGVPLEALVSTHTDHVLTAGPVRYRFRGHAVSLAASAPWTAVTERVLGELEALEVDASEVVTVENLTPFEALCDSDLARRAVLVFTRGFLGRAQRAWLRQLVTHRAVRSLRHWGDLDPGGIRVFGQVRAVVAEAAPDVAVSPWRMHPELLGRRETAPLTDEDRRRLRAHLASPAPDLEALARELLRCGCKLEQEAMLLDLPSTSTP